MISSLNMATNATPAGKPSAQSLGLRVSAGVMGTRYQSQDDAQICVWENAPYAPRANSITEFIIPEPRRGQGLGRAMLEKILQLYDPQTLCAAASSAASVKLLYEAGFRPTQNPLASLEQAQMLREELSSVTMAVPIFEKPKNDLVSPSMEGHSDTPWLIGANGQPLTLFHGSPIDDIERFEDGVTAYGIFFTPDKETASYYAVGPRASLYAVHVKAKKVADFDDPEVFEVVMREAIDFGFERNDEQARAFAKRLYDQGYGKNEHVTAFFNDLPGFDFVDHTAYTVTDLLSDNGVDASEVDDLVERINQEHITQAYDSEAPASSEELEQARQAYGSQEFYMNYQDDFMRAARCLGYDAVVFTDPSSRGEPTSYVVFDPDCIHVIDRVDYCEKPSTPKTRTSP